jgi:hypothetical protein
MYIYLFEISWLTFFLSNLPRFKIKPIFNTDRPAQVHIVQSSTVLIRVPNILRTPKISTFLNKKNEHSRLRLTTVLGRGEILQY